MTSVLDLYGKFYFNMSDQYYIETLLGNYTWQQGKSLQKTNLSCMEWMSSTSGIGKYIGSRHIRDYLKLNQMD